MEDSSEIPLIHAIPITDDSLPLSPSTCWSVVDVEVTVPLPVNASSGFFFEDDPPRVGRVVNDTHQRLVGYYFSKLLLPGLEISGIFDCNFLRDVLIQNQNLPRTLVLTDTPPKRGDVLYSHELPKMTGLMFSGFPPVVKSILDESWMGRVRVGQAVHAVCIPGRDPFMMNSGGFTATRVQELIDETSHIDGRRLILKDHKEKLKTKEGSRDLFDLEGCLVS